MTSAALRSARQKASNWNKPKVGDFVRYKYGGPYGIVLRFSEWQVGRGKPPIPVVVIDKGGGRESIIPIVDTVVINRGGWPNPEYRQNAEKR